MALTLLEAAKEHGDNPFRQGLIELYGTSTDVLMALPFETIGGGAIRFGREGALPDIGTRSLNEGFTESTGTTIPNTETVAMLGGDIDVDKNLVKWHGPDLRSAQEQMAIKHLAHKFSDLLINGDATADVEQFNGLQVRIPTTSSQYVANDGASGALSLLKLDEVLDTVDDFPGARKLILMNKVMRRRLTAAARNSTVAGNVEWTQDQMGRKQMFYGGAEIIVVGGNGDKYTPLPFDEGAGTDETSIYVVAVGEGLCTGIHNEPPDGKDLGELQTKPVFRTRVEWNAGLSVWHPRAIARLGVVKNAAVVA